jgi:hypothetical protein
MGRWLPRRRILYRHWRQSTGLLTVQEYWTWRHWKLADCYRYFKLAGMSEPEVKAPLERTRLNP